MEKMLITSIFSFSHIVSYLSLNSFKFEENGRKLFLFHYFYHKNVPNWIFYCILYLALPGNES